MRKITGFILLLTCALQVNAQSDTLKKYSNGNILLQQPKKLRLMSPQGIELASWSPYSQYIRQWGKTLNVVERTDSTGKTWSGVVDDQLGEFVVPPVYESISRYNATTGVYMLRQGKKYGFYSPASGKLIPAVYNQVSRHINLDWQILCSDKCGYIYDEQLRLLDSIPGMIAVENRIRNRNNEWLELNLTDCRGLLDVKNKLLVKKEWTRIYAVRGRTVIVDSKKGIGQFDLLTGKIIMPYQPFSYQDDATLNGRIVLNGRSKSILLDSLGKPSLYFTAEYVNFSSLYPFGGFYFKDKGLWGIMSNTGKIIQKPVWEYVSTSLPAICTATLPDKSTRHYYLIEKRINGQTLLTGIRQLTPEEVSRGFADEQEQIMAVPPEEFKMTNLPDAPGPSREEEENKIYLKMEVDPRFTSSEENEKPELRQRIEAYKKEHKIKMKGTVIVKLVVEKDGKISSTTIVSSADPLLTEATKNLLSTITSWRPGIQNGRNVRGEKTLTFEW